MTHQNKSYFLSGAFAALILIGGCNPKPENISFGKDSCAECKMIIMNPHFGGEIVTKKGKIFKFDDVHCVATFLERRGVELSEIHHTLFVDYNAGGNQLVPVRSAEFVVSSKFQSPMGGNAAAFKTQEEAKRKSLEIEGSKVTNWATLYNILIK